MSDRRKHRFFRNTLAQCAWQLYRCSFPSAKVALADYTFLNVLNKKMFHYISVPSQSPAFGTSFQISSRRLPLSWTELKPSKTALDHVRTGRLKQLIRPVLLTIFVMTVRLYGVANGNAQECPLLCEVVWKLPPPLKHYQTCASGKIMSPSPRSMVITFLYNHTHTHIHIYTSAHGL